MKPAEPEREIIVQPNPNGGWRIEFPRSHRDDYPSTRQRAAFVVVMMDKEEAMRFAVRLGQQALIRVIPD